jgi:DNA-binding response OmpR family regulator
MKILIVEDEKIVADNIKVGLEQHRFTVDVAYNGQEGLELARNYDYDIIILDLMLPDIPGEELCVRIRKEKIDSFILMLTAKKQVENIVEGLNCGADDYLTKPFEFTELLARLRALLRRKSKDKENILTAFEIKVDIDSEKVFAGEKEVKLTKKEFMVLEYLLRHKGQVISRNQILEHAWDRNVDIFTNIVDTHIKNIRKKLGKQGRYIETIYGSGYRVKDDSGVHNNS